MKGYKNHSQWGSDKARERYADGGAIDFLKKGIMENIRGAGLDTPTNLAMRGAHYVTRAVARQVKDDLTPKKTPPQEENE